MTTYAEMRTRKGLTCDNQSGPGGATNTSRGLTHSLDYGEEGLAMQATRTCSIDGCDRFHSAMGWCNLHYQRYLAHGDPTWTPPTTEDRFWARVDRDGPIPEGRPDLGACWLWTGSKHAGGRTGYGWSGRRIAHRMAYELAMGKIPSGLQIDHLCRVRLCVRPDHLEAVTQQENILRGEAPNAIAVRTGHCRRGHEFAGSNLYVTPNGDRRCLACVAIREARYRAEGRRR